MLRSLVALTVVAALVAPARAEDADATRRARAHFRQGQAYQEAGAYDQAIAEFEAAYALTPLPALLFNLGQARRLKGDKAGAVDSYRRFLDAVPDGRGSNEARSHVAQLVAEIDREKQATPAPSPSPSPETVRSPEPVVTPSPAPVEIVAVPVPMKKPLYKRWWLWTAVGGVAVVGLAVGLGVGLTRPTHYPNAGTPDGKVTF